MKNISVLIPSRGRPEEFGSCVENLFDLAESPDELEVIVRLDDDDPTWRRYPNFRHTRFLVGPRYGGYAENHRLIEEAARMSTGLCIMQYVDTARMLVPYWDQLYLMEIEANDLYVATADVEDENGKKVYPWSFPFIPRNLYEICGMFCLGENPSVDRCYEALAKELNCRIHVPVRIMHQEKRNTPLEDQTAKESQPFYKKLNKDWEKRSAEHQMIGRTFAKIVRAHL